VFLLAADSGRSGAWYASDTWSRLPPIVHGLERPQHRPQRSRHRDGPDVERVRCLPTADDTRSGGASRTSLCRSRSRWIPPELRAESRRSEAAVAKRLLPRLIDCGHLRAISTFTPPPPTCKRDLRVWRRRHDAGLETSPSPIIASLANAMARETRACPRPASVRWTVTAGVRLLGRIDAISAKPAGTLVDLATIARAGLYICPSSRCTRPLTLDSRPEDQRGFLRRGS